MDYDPIYKEFVDFTRAFFFYLTHRLRRTGLNFEKYKNFVVDILMVRRGANTSMFVHGSVIGLALVVLGFYHPHRLFPDRIRVLR